jgi:hypothetical protein
VGSTGYAVGPMGARCRRASFCAKIGDYVVIDKVYSYAYMDQSIYRELMKRARADLANAVEKRRSLLTALEETEKEIAQLKRLIGGIYACADRIDVHSELCAGEGLKDAVCTALRSATEDVTISGIIGHLEELQFPVQRHQNPLGSVYTTVMRLMAEGEVVAGEPQDEKKTYRWARTELKGRYFARALPQIQVVTMRESKKRSR